jgi:enoyl-CoA hydratase
MDRFVASAKPGPSITRWHKLPVPVRRGLITARRLSHPGRRPRPHVQFEIVDGVALITIDDGKVNAISQRMSNVLHEALDRLETDQNIRAIVLAGRPGQFCAGFDLDTLMIGGAARDHLLRRGWELIRRLYMLPLPVVTACTGNAVALGAALLLMGDVRLGAEGEFTIGFNEAAIGFPLPGVLLMLAAERLTEDACDQAIAGARMHSPDQARAAGFLHRVLPPSELLSAAIAEAEQLCKLPAESFQEQKQTRIAQNRERIQKQLQKDLALIEQIGG